MMRKPRDIDAELKALRDRTKMLKERKVRQFGELVIATGADMLDADILAGALLEVAKTDEPARKESWRKSGSALFQGSTKSRKQTRGDDKGAAVDDSKAAPA